MGIVLAYWLTNLVNVWRPPIDAPVIPRVVLDTHVLLFAAVVSLLTGLLFGSAPALQSTRGVLIGAIKNEAPSEKLRRLNLRDILVAVQVALSVVLLIGSILVVRSLQHALSLNLGFKPDHAAVLSVDLARKATTKNAAASFSAIYWKRFAPCQELQAAGMIDGLPLTLNISNSGVFFEGKPYRARAMFPWPMCTTLRPAICRLWARASSLVAT